MDFKANVKSVFQLYILMEAEHKNKSVKDYYMYMPF